MVGHNEQEAYWKFQAGSEGPLEADPTLPAVRPSAAARRFMRSRRAAVPLSDLDLLRDLQGIIDLNAEVTDRRLEPIASWQ